MSTTRLRLPGHVELPRISAGRVALRQLGELDLDRLFAVFSDPEVTRYFGLPCMRERADAERLLRDIEAGFAERRLYQWGVTIDDVVIGTCTLNNFEERSRRTEIGFALERAQWGHGYMGEALTALLGYAFGELDLRRIEADVDPRNEASIRKLEQLGFHREGLLRERWLVGDEIQDTVMYGLLKRDWPPRHVAG